MQIQVAQPGKARKRVTRTPNFPISGGMSLMGLYPWMYHPVLPGETLKMISAKATVVSPPLAGPLTGAWLETFNFYVRLTDIDQELGEMFIGGTTSSQYTRGADNNANFVKAGERNWCALAMQQIYRHFFLDEGEADRTLSHGVFETKLIKSDWAESQVKLSDYDGADALATEVDELTPQVQAFMAMRQMGMSEMSYDEYLKMYGVRTVTVEEGKPEMLSYRRYFTKPSNVLDPATGAPTGAWYWNVDEKNDKPKMFKEPGFVISCAVVRPKVFDSVQVSSVCGSMWGFEDWFPVYTLDDPAAGIVKETLDDMSFLSLTGTTEYYRDRRDLLYHGEQFNNRLQNHTVPEDASRVAGATDQDLRGMYLVDDTNLFASAGPTITDYDGIVSLNIAGHIQDNT